MRIVLLSAEYPPQPGGVGDYTQQLAGALCARGQSVTVLTGGAEGWRIVDAATADERRLPEQRGSGWSWDSWPATIAALDRLRPDVLHIQYQTGAYQMRPAINLLPWRLRGLPGRPRVAVTAHDLLLPYLFPKAGPARRWVTRRLLIDADATIVTNASDLDELGRSYPARARMAASASYHAPQLIPIGSNIAVAPPAGFDRGGWRAQLGVAPQDLLIAYFGLISPSKGLHTLLDALAQLPEPYRLLIVGGAATQPQDRAYAEQIERQIDGLGLRRRVQITGHCDAASVSAHLLAADIAALPFSDGASFRRGSLLAALGHGLPTVTTVPRGPAHGELRDSQQALLVAPEDAGALAAAIARLGGDAALRAQLGAGGRALAAQFGWDAIAAQHEQLYQELLERASAAARPSTSSDR